MSQTIPPVAGDGGDIEPYWWWRWYGHQNLRDDRAEAFSSLLPGGTYEYTYVARATTPGTLCHLPHHPRSRRMAVAAGGASVFS